MKKSWDKGTKYTHTYITGIDIHLHADLHSSLVSQVLSQYIVVWLASYLLGVSTLFREKVWYLQWIWCWIKFEEYMRELMLSRPEKWKQDVHVVREDRERWRTEYVFRRAWDTHDIIKTGVVCCCHLGEGGLEVIWLSAQTCWTCFRTSASGMGRKWGGVVLQTETSWIKNVVWVIIRLLTNINSHWICLFFFPF